MSYIQTIDKFIPRASNEADRLFPEPVQRPSEKPSDYALRRERWAASWSSTYHAEMDRLVSERGIRNLVEK